MTGLPATIGGLRRAMARAAISVDEALATQAAAMRAYGVQYRCVATLHDLSTPANLRGKSSKRVAAPSDPDQFLAGVGLAHKDIFYREGVAPGCGRPVPVITPEISKSGTAPVLMRLKAAGAADLAALQMAEFACGATGENAWAETPVNPLGTGIAVGGSSSGSAVAVAAGLCYASLGTDTAGSVRIPAATCGVLGLKPTQGLLATTGVFPLAPSLDTVGILARSAADIAGTLAGVASRQCPALRAAAGDAGGIEAFLLSRPTARIRHGLEEVPLRDDVHAVIDTFLARLPGIQPAALPGLSDMHRCAEVVLHTEAAQVHAARLRSDEVLGRFVRAVALPGMALPAVWYREAIRRRARYLAQVMATGFGDADILLLPALPQGVPDWAEVHSGSAAFDGRALTALYALMPFINYLGLPALVFPLGSDQQGRPVSVQAVGRPGAEITLLAFAYRVERERFGNEGVPVAAEPLKP
ncbi:amidase [Cupriavidus sp. IK-TO18]|uniref:amidase n=1 Tax=Cupriavidus sp. IK-TO18 TaxID=2782182 RepID=UPI00189B84B5|nr:amidase [Cupriavidus sp. IK-TO18]MBF6989073.1 amidase [Cupriavidus sp. IK-TO18]